MEKAELTYYVQLTVYILVGSSRPCLMYGC